MNVIKCPKCGMTQLAQEACRGCGKSLPRTEAPSAPRSTPVPASALPLRASPSAPSASHPPAKTAGLDPAFDRDRFLLRQRMFSINQKYEVWDERGQPVLFVERPAHLGRNLLAALAGLAAGLVTLAAALAVTVWLEGSNLGILVFCAGLLAAGVVGVAVGTTFGQKRHITFYRDASRSEPLLETLQDHKFKGFTLSFTVKAPDGTPLARLHKNVLGDILRKKWVAETPDGRLLCVVKEDLLHAILSRVVGKLFPMNFRFYLDGERQAGRFDRKFTLLDRYVLDLSEDPNRRLDRRVALALGVLLDTGERR